MAENNTTVEVENNTTTTYYTDRDKYTKVETEANKEVQTKEKPKVEKKKEKKHIIIDPITRIEGHLRIEAIIDENNRIVDAYSSSTMLGVWRPL